MTRLLTILCLIAYTLSPLIAQSGQGPVNVSEKLLSTFQAAVPQGVLAMGDGSVITLVGFQKIDRARMEFVRTDATGSITQRKNTELASSGARNSPRRGDLLFYRQANDRIYLYFDFTAGDRTELRVGEYDAATLDQIGELELLDSATGLQNFDDYYRFVENETTGNFAIVNQTAAKGKKDNIELTARVYANDGKALYKSSVDTKTEDRNFFAFFPALLADNSIVVPATVYHGKDIADADLSFFQLTANGGSVQSTSAVHPGGGESLSAEISHVRGTEVSLIGRYEEAKGKDIGGLFVTTFDAGSGEIDYTILPLARGPADHLVALAKPGKQKMADLLGTLVLATVRNGSDGLYIIGQSVEDTFQDVVEFGGLIVLYLGDDKATKWIKNIPLKLPFSTNEYYFRPLPDGSRYLNDVSARQLIMPGHFSSYVIDGRLGIIANDSRENIGNFSAPAPKNIKKATAVVRHISITEAGKISDAILVDYQADHVFALPLVQSFNGKSGVLAVPALYSKGNLGLGLVNLSLIRMKLEH